jgi:hypothetical protein
MTTVRELVTDTLRLIEEVGAGETPTAEDAADCKNALVQMLASWSVSGDMIFTQTRETYVLTPGQKAYTWGTGGNINTARPYLVREAFIIYPNNLTSPIAINDWSQYALITNKEQNGVPSDLYIDYNFPLTNLVFWYVPSENYTLHLYSLKPLTEFTSLSDVISMPPGWLRAMKYNLAVEVAPMFGKEASKTVQKIAIQSKSIIETAVAQSDKHLLRSDLGLQAMSQYNRYDVFTGQWY